MMRRNKTGKYLLGSGFGLIVLFLILPLLIVIAVSFTSDIFMTFPPKGLSLQWYRQFLVMSDWREAIKNSIIIASGTAVLSTSIALVMGFVLARFNIRFGALIKTLGMMPFLLPPVIIGIAFMAFFYAVGFSGTLLNVVIAHGIFYSSLPLMLISVGFESVNKELEEAAMSLGATELKVLSTVTLPLIRNDIFAGALFAFILSLNEYFIAFLVAGFTVTTLPIKIFSSLRYSYSPTIAAVSVFFIIITTLVVILIDRLTEGIWD
jgi:ABC-type spermidine/putrescine transport system permease subunit II